MFSHCFFFGQFVKDSGNYVEEKKLKVILISPIESPTLSPINGNLSHGLGHETSFLKDQSVNGVENLSKQHMVREALFVILSFSYPLLNKCEAIFSFILNLRGKC